MDQRENIPSWDEYFIGLAKHVAIRSKDPVTQVGAVIVASDHRILSLGYNGAPKGMSDEEMPWGKTSDNPLETKYPYVAHAEANAIANYKGSGRDLEGGSIYVTLFPCNQCAIQIVGRGIKNIYYEKIKNEDRWDVQASKRILDNAGVKYHQISHSNDIVIPVGKPAYQSENQEVKTRKLVPENNDKK